MIRGVILDTGPLVAFLVADEVAHEWTVAQLENIQLPLLSCEPVITEACFLLREHSEGIEKIKSFLEHGTIRLEFRLEDHRDRVFALMHNYRNVPMSLADACLVCMAETVSDGRVLTLDSDFKIYRKHRNQAIPLIIP
jgi:predicted nucleic acid-binding protein